MANEVQEATAGKGGETAAGPLAVLARVGRVDPQRILALGLVLFAFEAFFTYTASRIFNEPMTLLYSDLDGADAREIIDRLDATQVAYELTPDGRSIMVPADRVLRLRMDLASEGLPGSAGVGYEIFDDANPLTTTDFQSNVNLTRALEGELARTIGSMRSVKAARVHLVQTERRLIERDQVAPSASIVLSLRQPGGLEKRQIDGIRHLVAAAVPGLSLERVTIVDDRGELLARADDGSGQSFLDATFEEQRGAYEERLRQRIERMLERSLGPGKVHAAVSAEMEFDDLSVQSETFDPQGQVARSVQTIEDTSDRTERDPDDDVTVENNLPTGDEPAEGAPTSRERAVRTEDLTNYEISTERRQQTRRGPRVTRLTVAVQVDGRYESDAGGEPRFVPLPAAELEELEALVRSAAGIDDERGDMVEIVSRPMHVPSIEPPAEPGMLDLEERELWRAVELAVFVILSMIALFFGVRPLLRRMAEGPGEQIERLRRNAEDEARAALEAEGYVKRDELMSELADAERASGGEPEEEDQRMISIDNISGQVKATLVDQVSELVSRHPDHAVRVLRNWLHSQ